MVVRTALNLTVPEAERLLARVRGSRFLSIYGIEVFTEADMLPMVLGDGTKHPAVFVKVRASTEFRAGEGVGFLVAISEGVVK